MTTSSVHKCPVCKSAQTVWRGYRYNRSGKKHLRQCNRCGRKFTPDEGFLRMRYKPDDILYAVKLYQKGKSSAQVVDTLSRRGVKVSRWTVIKWARKYAYKGAGGR